MKDKNHSHYWVEDKKLYESYNTLRGLRYRFIVGCPGISDCEKCSDDMVEYLFKEFKV